MKRAILMVASAVFIMSCGDGTTNENATQESTTPDETAAPMETEEAPAEDIPAEVTLTIEGNDQMQYNKDELTVHEGQKVTLVLKHVGELPKKAMGHNWVLLSNDVTWEEFSKEALKFNDNDYMPEDLSNVIAHTDMIGGGEETSVTFDAPAPGTYTFLCTFPGHASQMNGEFIVE